jgi:phasin family protein
MTQKAGKTSSTAQARKPANTYAPFESVRLDNPFLTQGTTQAMETIMTQGKTQFEKIAQDANDFGREGYEAFIKSSTVFARGFEEILKASATLAQTAAEKQSQFIKDALSSKTLNEWTEVQNKIAQENFDDFLSGATKLSEMSVKVITEAVEPLNKQLGKSMKKATDSMAA